MQCDVFRCVGSEGRLKVDVAEISLHFYGTGFDDEKVTVNLISKVSICDIIADT